MSVENQNSSTLCGPHANRPVSDAEIRARVDHLRQVGQLGRHATPPPRSSEECETVRIGPSRIPHELAERAAVEATETIVPPRFPRAAVALEAELIAHRLGQIATDCALISAAAETYTPGACRRKLNACRAALADLVADFGAGFGTLCVALLLVAGCCAVDPADSKPPAQEVQVSCIALDSNGALADLGAGCPAVLSCNVADPDLLCADDPDSDRFFCVPGCAL